MTGEACGYNFFAAASGQPDNNSSAPFGDGAAGEDYVQLVWRNTGRYANLGAWNDVHQAGHGSGDVLELPHLWRQGYIIELTAVPLRGALSLFLTGLAGLGVARWRAGRAAG